MHLLVLFEKEVSQIENGLVKKQLIFLRVVWYRTEDCRVLEAEDAAREAVHAWAGNSCSK